MVFNKKLLAVSIALIAQGAIAQNDNDEIETEVVEGEITEEVIVFGVRQSLKNALDTKRDAGNIVDAISAEEVGKLPDNNIAEALQRITGVQIGRNRKGAGGEFQIRGLVNNRVEVNGRGRAVSGHFSNGESIDETRASNFEGTPSALYKRVEVHKTPQAKHVEGSSGGTVKLVTWKPLDFKDDYTFNFSAEGIDDSLSDDLGNSITALFATSFSVGNAGEIGILLNLQSGKEYNRFREVATQISPAEYFGEGFQPDATGLIIPVGAPVDFSDESLFTVLPAQNTNIHDLGINFNAELNNTLATAYMPNNFTVEQRDYETENLAIDFTVQWRLNERFQLSFQYEESESDEFGDVALLFGNIRDREGIVRYVAEAVTRPISGIEEYFVPGSRESDGRAIYTDDPDRGTTRYTGDVTRYFISAGEEDGFHRRRPQSNRPLGVRGDTDSVDRFSEFFFVEGDWDITDDVNMKFGYSDSRTERDRFRMQNRFGVGVDPARYVTETSPGVFERTINPETGEAFFPTGGRQNRGAINPTVGWNYRNGDDVPDLIIGLDYINQARAAQGWDPLSLASPELYQFQNVRAPFIEFNFGEQSEATIDFDWNLDNDIFSSLEFGWRRTEDFTDRDRYEQGVMHLDTYLASIEQGFQLLSADDELSEFYHRDAWGASVKTDSIVGLNWVNDDDNPDNNVTIVGAGNDYENISALYAANAEGTGLAITDFLGGPGNFGIPASVGGGDIPRTFLRPAAYSREGWINLFERYFPGRLAHDCGADGICAHDLIGINPDTGEYYTQADRRDARDDDVGAIRRAGFFLDPEGGRLLEETVNAMYFQANIDTNIGIPLTGNIGVRYVDTDVFSFQRAVGTEGADEFGFVPGNANYSELLPSLNLSFEVQEGMFVKLALSRTIERQNPQDLAFKRTFDGFDEATVSTDNLKIDLGNPGLKPTSSRNFDLSWEWYFNEESLVSVTYFQKDQEDIVEEVRVLKRYIPSVDPFVYDNPDIPAPFWNPNDPDFDAEAIEELGFDLTNPYIGLDGEGAITEDPDPNVEGDETRFDPNDARVKNPNFDPRVDFTANDDLTTLTADEIARGVRIIAEEEPRNVDDGKIDGWELSYQQPFNFLPSPFDGFGTVINATFIDSERDTGVQEYSGTPRPLNKLSDKTYNVIFYYEKYNFSARIAYNWRSEWRGGFAGNYDSREFYVEDPDAAARNAADPTILRAFSENFVNGDEYENALSKTDISLSYDFEDTGVRIYLQGDDIFESASIRYLEPSENFVRRYRSNGAIWRFGVSAKLGI